MRSNSHLIGDEPISASSQFFCKYSARTAFQYSIILINYLQSMSLTKFSLRRLAFAVFGISASCFPKANAQTTLNPSMEQFVPPSPNVNALNKFGNIPVGQSTGIPSVSIPIYTWQGKNFGQAVSVSLNYHLGGIKVDETASNVGLGWALSAGGVISRSMRGICDETPTYGFLNMPQLPSTNFEGNDHLTNSERKFYKMNSGVLDTQNDLFNYNFAGRSGRFVLGRNADSLLLLDQSKIRIQKTLGTVGSQTLIVKFIITDERGYKFIFEDFEQTAKVGVPSLNPYYTSAWYLTKIVNPAGTVAVQFSYENTFFRNSFSGTYTHAYHLFTDGISRSVTMGGGADMDINGKRIKKISFPDGNEVEFFYDPNQRQDQAGDYLLKKILVKKNNVQWGFKFAHDYSLSGRATLLSATPIGGASETADKPYSFEYVSSVQLPAKFSVQQDHWGYANYNSGDRIPHEWLRVPGGEYPPFREFSGGNRDTHPDRVKAGSMVRINYPTGGYTLFDMEANQAKDNWLEQNDTVTVQAPPYTHKSLNEPLNSDNYPAASIPFVFGGENNTTTQFDITINPMGGTCSSGCALKFEIWSASNTMVASEQINFTDPSPDPFSITKYFSVSGLAKNATYTIRVYAINVTSYYEYCQINWREVNAGTSSQVVLSHVQPYVGGLRAKKVSDFTGVGIVPATVKEYSYLKEDEITSSGALGTRPTYTNLLWYTYKLNEANSEPASYNPEPVPNYAVRSSSTVYDLAYANGSPVTYSRVVEKLTSNGVALGKTIRYFTNFIDNPPVDSLIYPNIPTKIAPWSYGLLKREDVYDQNNVLLRRTENTYNHLKDNFDLDTQRKENFRSISIAPVKFEWNPIQTGTIEIWPNRNPHYFLMSSFYPLAGRAELVKSKITEYIPGKPALTTVTTNEYDASNFYLKRSKTVNSKGQETKRETEYIKDRLDANQNTAVYGPMYNYKNMINTVVGQKEYLNNTELAAQRTEYALFPSGVYEPQVIYSKKQGHAEEARIRYLGYNPQGTPVSVSQEGGVPVCYVWGYGGDYLIAKVTNANYSDVQTLLGGASNLHSFMQNSSPTDAQVEAFIAPLRINLPNAQVESFTYHTLLGVTSSTDIKGEKSYFVYDDFGRLKHIKDQQQHILKSFDYHHKN